MRSPLLNDAFSWARLERGVAQLTHVRDREGHPGAVVAGLAAYFFALFLLTYALDPFLRFSAFRAIQASFLAYEKVSFESYGFLRYEEPIMLLYHLTLVCAGYVAARTANLPVLGALLGCVLGVGFGIVRFFLDSMAPAADGVFVLSASLQRLVAIVVAGAALSGFGGVIWAVVRKCEET